MRTSLWLTVIVLLSLVAIVAIGIIVSVTLDWFIEYRDARKAKLPPPGAKE
jgi:hypothetical protein